MGYFLAIVKIVHVLYQACVAGKCIKKTNQSNLAEKFLKYFYRLVSWLTNQLYGKQMSLTKDDNKNYILTLDGRQHKIENESRQLMLFRILGWM